MSVIQELAACAAIVVFSNTAQKQKNAKVIGVDKIVNAAAKVAYKTLEMMIALGSMIFLNSKQLRERVHYIRERVHYNRMFVGAIILSAIGAFRILQRKSMTRMNSNSFKDIEPTEIKKVAKVIASIATVAFAFQGMYLAAVIGTVSVILPFAEEMGVIPTIFRNAVETIEGARERIINGLLLFAVSRICIGQPK